MEIFKILKTLCNSEASKEGRIVGVFFRFILTHIRFLFVRQFKFKWENGTMLWAVQHRHSSTSCYYFGMYDYNEMNFLKKYIREEDCFVDVGSNIGSYSIFAASCGASVISLEAAPSTYQLQKENIKLNKSIGTKIKKMNIAIGETEGDVKFTIDNDTTNRVVKEGNIKDNVVSVQCKPLDSIVDIAEIIKIDVEGYELPVLKGATRLLMNRKLNVIIIEAFNEKEIMEILQSYEFRPYDYDVRNNSLVDIDERQNGNNIIFIRDYDLAVKRLHE